MELFSELVKPYSCSLTAAWFEWAKSVFVDGVSYSQRDTRPPVAWRTQWLCPSPTGRPWCPPAWCAPPSVREKREKKAQRSHQDQDENQGHTTHGCNGTDADDEDVCLREHQARSHQVWCQRGLEVQQNADNRYLLQPLAAGLLAVLLVFTGVVEARAERRQQLLSQRAQGARGCLAEDHIPSQL